MNEQLELFVSESFGLPKPSKPRNARPREVRPRYNVFLAILPDSQTVQQVLNRRTGLLKNHRVTGSFRPPHKLHVSLLGFSFSDTVPEEVKQALHGTADAVASHTPPFEVSLSRLCSFGRGEENRPLVLTEAKGANPQLVNLFQALVKKWSEDFGPIKDERFTPHITLLYGRHAIHDEPVELVTWMAKEIVLILSERGAEKYQLLGRWLLGA